MPEVVGSNPIEDKNNFSVVRLVDNFSESRRLLGHFYRDGRELTAGFCLFHPIRAGQIFEIFKCFKYFKKYFKNVSGNGNFCSIEIF